MADTDKQHGLYGKYIVTRNNNTEKHKDCRYFVLDPVHDELARTALSFYAGAALAEGYEELANDIVRWLGEINQAEKQAFEDRLTERIAEDQNILEQLE